MFRKICFGKKNVRKMFFEKVFQEICFSKNMCSKNMFSKMFFSKQFVQSTTSHEIERNFQDIFLKPSVISHLRLRANFLAKTSKKNQNNLSFCIFLLVPWRRRHGTLLFFPISLFELFHIRPFWASLTSHVTTVAGLVIEIHLHVTDTRSLDARESWHWSPLDLRSGRGFLSNSGSSTRARPGASKCFGLWTNCTQRKGGTPRRALLILYEKIRFVHKAHF